MLAGLIVILLDELLQKGYGLGSGISLFMYVEYSLESFSDAFWVLRDVMNEPNDCYDAKNLTLESSKVPPGSVNL